jgi:hypothetical protein
MRAHAHVENHIERLKESGLCRFPFSDFEANANWMAIVLLAADQGLQKDSRVGILGGVAVET